MNISTFTMMLSYMLVNSFTPGPGNILALNTTAQFGWKTGKCLVFGICTGYLCVQLLCTLAVYQLKVILMPVLSVLKYAGGLYMVWLAIHLFRCKPQSRFSGEVPSFRTGLLLQLVNVKIYFYILTLLTAYLLPAVSSLPVLFLCGLGVVVVGSGANLTWALLGTKLQSFYTRQYQIINSILSLFLLYCAWNIIRS